MVDRDRAALASDVLAAAVVVEIGATVVRLLASAWPHVIAA